MSTRPGNPRNSRPRFTVVHTLIAAAAGVRWLILLIAAWSLLLAASPRAHGMTRSELGAPHAPAPTWVVTLLGGESEASATAVAVDEHGNMYVTGTVAGAHLPVVHAAQKKYGGSSGLEESNYGLVGVGDAFVIKVSPRGRILYSTYLGGRGSDIGTGIALDRAGDAYVTGWTTSQNFPVRRALMPRCGLSPAYEFECFDAFVAKLDGAGHLLFSTYLGGRGAESPGYQASRATPSEDKGRGIAVDRRGNVIITGSTDSYRFPLVHAAQGPGDPKHPGGAFVTKLDSSGQHIIYSTFLGTDDGATGNAVTTDRAGNAYVLGSGRVAVGHATVVPPRGHSTGPLYFVVKLTPDGRVRYRAQFDAGDGGDSTTDLEPIALW